MRLPIEGGGVQGTDQGSKLNYIRAWCLEAYRYSKDRHEQKWCRDALSYYSLYRNYTRSSINPDDGHSNISLGLAFPLVKIMSARLCAPWQAGDRLMECTPNDGYSMSKAPLIASYVNDKLMRQIPRAFSKLELAKESAIALGRGVIKPYIRKSPPRTILRRKPIRLPIPLPGYPQGITIGSYLGWDRDPGSSFMTFDYIDPFQFWYMGTDRWPTPTNGAGGAEQTFEIQYLTQAEVASRIDSKEWNVKFDYSAGSALGYDQWYERRIATGFGDNITAQGQTPKPHRYLEIQGLVETRQRSNGLPVFEQAIVGLLDERDIVKYDKLGTWDGTPDYIVFELFQDIAAERPLGLIEPCEQTLYTIDDFFSIALDNARKILESSMACDPDSTQQTEMFLGAGALNWVRNPRNSLVPIEMKDLPQSFYELLIQLNEVLYRVSGISDLIGGVATQNTAQGADTARGMNLLANMATSRLSPLLTKMDMELYRPLAEWIHQTGKQRMDEDQYVRMASSGADQFGVVTPDDLDADVNFSFNLKALDTATGNRRAEFLQMFQLLMNPTFAQQLQGQGFYIDAMESARILMTEFDRGTQLPALVKRVGEAPALPQAAGGPAGPFATPGSPQLPGAAMPSGMQPPEGQPSPTGLPPLPGVQ